MPIIEDEAIRGFQYEKPDKELESLKDIDPDEFTLKTDQPKLPEKKPVPRGAYGLAIWILPDGETFP